MRKIAFKYDVMRSNVRSFFLRLVLCSEEMLESVVPAVKCNFVLKFHCALCSTESIIRWL